MSPRRRPPRSLNAEPLESRRLLAVFTVTDLQDDTLANLAGDGQFSLREAIEAANTDTSVDGSAAGSGADQIQFAPGLAGEILLAGGRLEVTDELTINGPAVPPGAPQLAIDGDRLSQVLRVGATTLRVDQLELRSGSGSTGGVIENDGVLIIDRSTIASGSASAGGGGVYNRGNLTLQRSMIQGNASFGDGGGIYNEGTVALISSTIGRNRANDHGGGIFNASGDVTVIHGTIAENRADANDTDSGDGGGIATAVGPSATTLLMNTLVAGNDAGFTTFSHESDLAGQDVDATSANNLVGDPLSSGGLSEGVGGNLVGDGIGGFLPLHLIVHDVPEPNGGPTFTYRVDAGSRVIDAGDSALATTPGDDGIPGTGDTNELPLITDQRDAPFDRQAGSSVDIGALEWQIVAPSLLTVTTTDDVVDYGDGDVSLREAIHAANGSAGDDVITFGGPVFSDDLPDTISLQLGQLWIFDENALTIRGPGSESLTIDARGESRVIFFEGFYGELNLEGMTITGGNSTYYGGGISFHDGDSLTITDSVITGNTATDDLGGGVYSSAPVNVTRSQIVGNSAGGSGGGLYSRDFSEPTTITDSVITGNTAGWAGGGVYASLLTVRDSTVTGNTAGGYGGGVAGFEVTSVRNTISGNRSGYSGGGIASYSTAHLRQTTVIGNRTIAASTDIDAGGGGLWVGNEAMIEDSSVVGNTATDDGGGILAAYSDKVTLVNSTVSGNRSSNGGGGGLFAYGSEVTLIQSTVDHNRAYYSGGGIGEIDNGTLTIHNSIVALNDDDGTAPDFVAPSSFLTDLDVRFSLIGIGEGTRLPPSLTPDAVTGNLVGTSVSPIDPLLGPLDVHGGLTPTRPLQLGSPAIDSADASLAQSPGPDGIPGNVDDSPLSNDQRGAPFVRSFGTGIDRGASERQTLDAALLIVTTTADSWDAGDGLVSLREAISHAGGSVGNDTITFGGPLFGDGFADTINLTRGQLLISGQDSLLIDGPGSAWLTIDAGQRSRVVEFNEYGDLSIHGVTLTGGFTNDDSFGGDGAGIRFGSEGTLTITDTVITGNTASGDGAIGGGVYSYGNVRLESSTISGNRSAAGGGGLYTTGELDVEGGTLVGNSAGSYGGGLWSAGDVTIRDGSVIGNTADGGGGGIHSDLGNVTVIQSSVTGNTADGDGGGIHATYAVRVANSTLTGNTATGNGGGIYAYFDVELRNSTLTGNTADGDGGGLFFDDGDTTIVHSTIVNNRAGGTGGGIGNLNDGAGESLTLHNSIVAQNVDSGPSPDFVPPSPPSRLEIFSSLIGDNTGTGLPEAITPDGETGNLVGDPLAAGVIDPRLAPLDDHGGPVATHSPLPDSPVLDRGDGLLLPPDDYDADGDGDTEEPLPWDARGFDRSTGARPDMGAAESQGFDFGDAPDPYPTLAAVGAAHEARGPRLGDLRDTEPDGQPSPLADGDGDDEDGVMFGEISVGADSAAVNISLSGALSGKVDAWLDFDGNGIWDASERILDSVTVTHAIQTLNFSLPPDLSAGSTFARVRISSDGGLSPDGWATDGEVEDLPITIMPPPQVESVVINGGDLQRSAIDTIRIAFDRIVDIDEVGGGPFQIVNSTTGDAVADVADVTEVGGKTVVDLTFTPGDSVNPQGGLIDGDYQLTIDAARITSMGVVLDGDGDGVAGGDHLFGDEEIDKFFRKYGDHDGSNLVNLFDFVAFRGSYLRSAGDPEYLAHFDTNGNDMIELFDFVVFRGNYGS